MLVNYEQPLNQVAVLNITVSDTLFDQKSPGHVVQVAAGGDINLKVL